MVQLKDAILLLFVLWMVEENSLQFANAHSGGLRGLQGFGPPPEPELPEIVGPFEISLRVRFDNWNPPGGGRWQRVFDFGSGPLVDHILLTQLNDTRKMTFSISDCVNDGTTVGVTSPNDAIDNGVIASWKVGLDPSGFMYMMKDGVELARRNTTCVVPNVTRTGKFIGHSHHTHDEPLNGAVLGIRIRNLPGDVSFSHLALQNIPGQIRLFSDFTASFYARFDQLGTTTANPQGSQHIFTFADSVSAPHTNQISFAQVGNTTDVEFLIERNGVQYSVIAANAIIVNEFAFWYVAVSNGEMSIQKDSTVLVSEPKPGMPNLSDYRQLMLIGESSDALNRPLDGVVLGLRVDR